MKYNLKSLDNGIYLLEFYNSVDLAMHFIRLQEYYESESNNFRGKDFDLLEYIEWYTKKHDGVFSYPSDWVGFNIPGQVMVDVYHDGKFSRNKYDFFMTKILNFIFNKEKDFYLVGALYRDVETQKHEVSHALWNLSNSYKASQYSNILKIPEDVREKLSSNLKDMGYVRSVIKDEMQAYLSTGCTKEFVQGIDYSLEKVSKLFIDTFERYAKDIF